MCINLRKRFALIRNKSFVFYKFYVYVIVQQIGQWPSKTKPIAHTHLQSSHSFFAASNWESPTVQVRKSVCHKKCFHLPTKVLRSHRGWSTSSLSSPIFEGTAISIFVNKREMQSIKLTFKAYFSKRYQKAERTG